MSSTSQRELVVTIRDSPAAAVSQVNESNRFITNVTRLTQGSH